MAYQYLTTEGLAPTLLITINRPKVYNALNAGLLAELSQVIDHFLQNEQYKGAILTGSGNKAFAAGADIAEVNQLPEKDAESFSRKGQDIFAKIESAPKPVIAAVNGFALGGGCELAMACHLRIAAENARFGQPEVNLGLIAGYGGTQRLPRLIGRGKATELLLTGDQIDAGTALQLGLVNTVVSQEELLPYCHKLLEKIYTKSPLATALTLKSIQAGYDVHETAYHTEAKAFGEAAGSADGKEGTAAFLEKRKPNFTGK